MTRASSTT